MRHCVICDKPIYFDPCETKDDVCSQECSDVYAQIPSEHVFWDFPQVQFIGGVPREQFTLERVVNGKIKHIKL